MKFNWRLYNVIFLGFGKSKTFRESVLFGEIQVWMWNFCIWLSKPSCWCSQHFMQHQWVQSLLLMQSKLKFKIQLRIKKSFKLLRWPSFINSAPKFFPNSLTDIDSLIGDGYISIALLYAVFAVANFFAPALVEAFGHKMALVSVFFKNSR